MRIMSARTITIAAMLLLACLLFASFLAAPNWDVTVVDGNGNPVPNISVTETWQNYSCENVNHTATLTTDAHGQVHFPPVHVQRNVTKCLHETASELAEGVHASLGRHVYINVQGLACVPDSHDKCIDWTGSPTHMTSRVILPGSH
ncbi:MAG: hypothetical protein JWQ42_4842 [Edaphobacter sp.]|nr:hypothetical protein [Edaphobacter sp.]